MENWINIHTHRPGRGMNIVDPCLGEVVLPEEGVVYYSAGVHPLLAGEDAEGWLVEVERLAREGRIVAVGEAGMDRNAAAPMERQTAWFERQVRVAAEYDLPVIIHGVRVIPELIAVAKRCMGRGDRWLIHGFNNRREGLQELLRHGFYISVGRQVMNRESHAYHLLPEIPLERLFLETDNSDYTIEEIYEQASERLGIGTEALQRTVADNFKRVFTKAESWKQNG